MNTATEYRETPQPETAEAFCNALQDSGLTYDAVFVPQSQSRNAGEKHASLNWRVTLARPGKPQLVTDYMQGIAHVPGYQFNARRTLDAAEREKAAAERGVTGGKRIPAPTFTDVLYCLVSDADVLEHGCFEDWAETYGYETDSREAERVYRDCIALALKLRQLINVAEAREAFEDY